MTKDENIVLSPEKIQQLQANLSRDAQLIRSSIRQIAKTDDALDAGLVGRFKVDVFVSPQGQVTKAILSRKIGFGMDPLVLQAARAAKFEPRRNAQGVAIGGWSQIVFRFTDD